jgi:hypothetical protein
MLNFVVLVVGKVLVPCVDAVAVVVDVGLVDTLVVALVVTTVAVVICVDGIVAVKEAVVGTVFVVWACVVGNVDGSVTVVDSVVNASLVVEVVGIVVVCVVVGFWVEESTDVVCAVIVCFSVTCVFGV